MTSNPASFYARKVDLDRLVASPAICYIVSGYDGAGNYGDVLQCAACVHTVSSASPAILPVVLINWAAADEFERLERIDPSTWERCVPLFYAGSSVVEPAAPSAFADVTFPPPVPSMLVVGGGGFLNQHWGPEKLTLIRRLNDWQEAAPNPRSRCSRPFAVGQQVSAWALADPAARRFIEDVRCLGVRDAASETRLASAGLAEDGRVFFSGDEATLEIAQRAPRVAPAPGRHPTITVHFSLAMNPGGLASMIEDALIAVADRSRAVRFQFVATHEDRELSEMEEQRPVVEALRARGVEVASYSLYPDPRAGIAAIAAGHLTIACSYHVALTSLLLGVPAFLIHGDPYYDEKHAALAQLFDLPDSMRIDAGATTGDAIAASVAAILDDDAVRRRATTGIATGSLVLSNAQLEGRRRLTRAVNELLDEAAQQDLTFAQSELADSLARLSDLRLMNNHVANEATRLLGSEAARHQDIDARQAETEARLESVAAQVGPLTTRLERLSIEVAAAEAARTAADRRASEMLAEATRERDAAIAALADKDRHIANLQHALASQRRTLLDRSASALSRALRGNPVLRRRNAPPPDDE